MGRYYDRETASDPGWARYDADIDRVDRWYRNDDGDGFPWYPDEVDRYSDEFDSYPDEFDDDDVSDPFGEPRRLRRWAWFAVGLLLGVALGVGGDRYGAPVLDAGRALVGSEVVETEPVAALDRAQAVESSPEEEPIDLSTGPVPVADDGSPVAVEAGADVASAPPGDGEATVGGGPPEVVVPVPVPATTGCTIGGSGLPIVELVNDSGELADFLVTIAVTDGGGVVQSEQPAEVYALRPGERTVEHVVVDEPGGIACDVVSLDRIPIAVTAAAAADVSSCEIVGPTASGEVAANLSITNPGTAATDYLVDLALVDPTGIRRGTGVVVADALAPGASLSVGVDTFVRYAPELQCQVVGVTTQPR